MTRNKIDAKRSIQRAPNLTDDSIRHIVGILDGWTGTLTWDALIEAIAEKRFTTYTRQALHKHERISSAFKQRKDAISEDRSQGVRTVESPELQLALDRIDRLQAVNQRLEAENLRLLEQFMTWAYNANARGLDETFLSQAIPKVSRDSSKPSKRTP